MGQSKNENFHFGLQFKPIITAAYFDSGDESAQWEDYNFELSPRFGQSLGMIVRYYLSSTFSSETGLNLVNRKYQLRIENSNIVLTDMSNFNLRSYEFPIQILSYVRISDKYYLNASFGNSLNIFASDVISFGEENPFFFQSTSRRKRIQSALIANLGMEYRTIEKGIFYLGFSLHRPWKNTARSYPEFDDGTNSFNSQAPSGNNVKFMNISGNYLTLDFRYFFPQKK
tara:strand:- start:10184 stop:10867 length:684 start_codon:yes stop_codon:yes gene_type:complete